MVDRSDGFQAVETLDFDVQLHRNGFDQLIGIQNGIDYERRRKIIAQLLKQRPAEGGLSRADLSGKLNKTLALANTVKEVIERLAVFRAEKQEARIGRNVKRRFLQPVVFQVHSRILRTCDGDERKKLKHNTCDGLSLTGMFFS